MNVLKKSVIFECKKGVGIVFIEDYRKYIYDNFITPNRICVVETSQDFWDDICDITNERLEEILKEELSLNPFTIYNN